MLKVKDGKISGKGTPDQLIEDFMVICVWVMNHIFIPTFKDKQTARYKLERILYDALDNIKEVE